MGRQWVPRTVRRAIVGAVHRRTAHLDGPVVSFAFDDVPRTACTVGAPILAAAGCRGTFYLAMSLMGTSGETGPQFEREDLESLAAGGHELASHTYSHLRCRTASAAAFRDDARKGRTAIEEAGLAPSRSFAYPYGDLTLEAKRVMGREMASCRGIHPGLNGPTVDLNLLRANALYGGVERMSMVTRWIRENRSGWLIFYTHDVRDRPSPWGCTPALLEAAVAAAVRDGGRVAPVAEVVASMGEP